ncbi:hypothetical protein, partial [Myroides sp. N17-2]|uniref:hypothetical protein n=1 Tax=Myroides sp. N17-2 TaxID=2030799 RepID=UPI001C1F8428
KRSVLRQRNDVDIVCGNTVWILTARITLPTRHLSHSLKLSTGHFLNALSCASATMWILFVEVYTMPVGTTSTKNIMYQWDGIRIA